MTARNRQIAQHRQWLMRSYAVTFIFVSSRVMDVIPSYKNLSVATAASVVLFINLLLIVIPDLALSWRAYRTKSARRTTGRSPGAAASQHILENSVVKTNLRMTVDKGPIRREIVREGLRSMPDHEDKEKSPDLAMRMALERTSASYDRTLMSWIRTAISLITFGFAIYKFFQIELQRSGATEGRAIGPREFSLIMVGAGLLAMALGIVDHWFNVRALRARDPSLPRSRTFAFASIVFALGLLALLAVIFRQ